MGICSRTLSEYLAHHTYKQMGYHYLRIEVRCQLVVVVYRSITDTLCLHQCSERDLHSSQWLLKVLPSFRGEYFAGVVCYTGDSFVKTSDN